jgi:CRP/FNR family transcriptional regulator, anaerobic regulatory protein
MRDLEIDAAWQGQADCDHCSIRDLVLFADLGAEDFGAIHLPIDDVRLPAGATLYRADQPAAALFTVREGVVTLEQYLPDGTRRIVGLARQGDVLGLEATLADSYEHTAVVLQTAAVCRIPREVVGRLSPRLHRQLMRKWHDSVQNAHLCIRDLSTGSARQRVARLFLLLAAPDRDRCRLFGREEVGALLGVTTETASKTVAEFKRAGLVREVAANVFERDMAALEQVADGS